MGRPTLKVFETRKGEILDLIRRGESPKGVAFTLGISLKAAYAHLKRLRVRWVYLTVEEQALVSSLRAERATK